METILVFADTLFIFYHHFLTLNLGLGGIMENIKMLISHSKSILELLPG